MRSATRSPDVFVSLPQGADQAQLDKLRALPSVAAVGAFSYTPVAPVPLKPGQDAGGIAALDDSFGVDVLRSLVIAGRPARADRADEITINERLAAMGFHVGQHVQLRAGFWPEVRDAGAATIVGVTRGEFDLGLNSAHAVVNLGHRFVEAHPDEVPAGPQPGIGARLRSGARGTAAFDRVVKDAIGPDAGAVGVTSAETVMRAIDVQRVAWTFLAAVAALAVLVAGGQGLSRTVASRLQDGPTIVALGMRPRQVAGVGAIIGAAIAVPAAAIAVGAAVVASPLVPRGLAQRADPARGIRLEPTPLALGGLLLIAVLVVAATLAGRSAARAAVLRERTTWVGIRWAPVPVRLGSQWATAPTPREAALTARSALIAVVAAVTGILAVTTFATSADALFSHPHLHGWSFDAGLTAEADGPGIDVAALAADGDVRDMAAGVIADISVDGKPVEAYALEQVKGGVVHPTVLRGHAPASAGEIALASGTSHDLHRGLGDSVEVKTPEGSTRLTVVGVAVYPELGNNGDLSHMASLTTGGLAHLESQPVSSIALVRVREGADVRKVAERHAGGGAEVVQPFEPPKVHNLHAAGAAPWILAGFLAVLLVAALGHALVMSVRARRSDIAVLRTLGLRRGGVAAAIGAQATTTVVLGAVIGLPLGIALGRAAWSLVASGLGVVNHPDVALPAIGVVLAGAAVVANLVASGPGWQAARVRPADVLRTE